MDQSAFSNLEEIASKAKEDESRYYEVSKAMIFLEECANSKAVFNIAGRNIRLNLLSKPHWFAMELKVSIPDIAFFPRFFPYLL